MFIRRNDYVQLKIIENDYAHLLREHEKLKSEVALTRAEKVGQAVQMRKLHEEITAAKEQVAELKKIAATSVKNKEYLAKVSDDSYLNDDQSVNVDAVVNGTEQSQNRGIKDLINREVGGMIDSAPLEVQKELGFVKPKPPYNEEKVFIPKKG